MAGTQTHRAKKALIDGVRLLLVENPDTAEVTVTYGYRGFEAQRESVHATRAFGRQSYPVMGGGGARFKRDSEMIIKLHVVVYQPGGDQEEAEARAVAIGTLIEEWIAATASLPGYEPGEVISVGIEADDLDGDPDDDGAFVLLTYDVAVNTRLN